MAGAGGAKGIPEAAVTGGKPGGGEGGRAVRAVLVPLPPTLPAPTAL